MRQEVNLKSFFKKLYRHKWLFMFSMAVFAGLALLYIKWATPIYEASTSLLIDPSGSNRVLGDSRYVEGGVSLIEMEKNLYNEIGIIKSFDLISQTVEDLGFGISYHSGDWFKKREHYHYFPFEAVLDGKASQLYDVPFEVEILGGNKYRLFVESKKFSVFDPSIGSVREVQRDFAYSGEYEFGEKVTHDYFNFTLQKPKYNVSISDFLGESLSFIVHNPEGVANGYASKIKVDNIDIQASIFKITSDGPVVAKEIDFLDKLTENYIQNKLSSRNDIAATKEAFIQEQLDMVSDSLLKNEIEMEMFQRDENAVDLDQTATNALDQTKDLQMERAKLELDIKYYNSLIRYVKRNRNSNDFVVPTTMGTEEDPLISDNISELKELFATRAKKRYTVTADNPEMKALNSQINESIGLFLKNLQNAIRSSRFAMEGLDSQMAGIQGEISSLPMRQKELLAIKRQKDLYENLFNYLSQELAKTGIARAESTSDTRVLDEARMLGSGPVAPQKMLIMVLALTLGALLPLAWIVGFSTNNEIENVDQIRAHTAIPVIASVVHHKAKSKKSGSSISLWKVKESFR
ncbi:MAG: GumC family protein, partial [Flavobacteriaceae bacterium]